MEYHILSEDERKRIDDERQSLVAMTESAALEAGSAIWYQRMRYLREVEAREFVDKLRRTTMLSNDKPFKRKYGKR